jgi:BirA family biotin operon repressor/biotin-[acetyl-CoA-carboxylase] ligase
VSGADASRALAGTRFGDVRWLAEVDSTNRVVAVLARAGAPDGLVVVADHQTAGRGRRGRSWEAPPGSSLLASVLLRPVPPLVTLAAALAAADACTEVAGVATELKWPNDVLAAGDGKLAGILAEAAGDAVVVGVGLNVDWGATPLPAGAASLGRPVDRAALLVAWLRRLGDPGESGDPGHVLSRYRARCATLGRRVRVRLPRETVEGVASDVDDDGRLVVGATRISAGDVVHLR